MAALHYSLKSLRLLKTIKNNTSHGFSFWKTWSKHYQTRALLTHDQQILGTSLFGADQNKVADTKLKTLNPRMEEKFDCLKLAHTKLIVEFGEENIEPEPSPEAWLCALENLDPSDDLALIEYFTFLAEKRKEREADLEEKLRNSKYETLTENENKIMLVHDSAITRFCHGNMAYAMMNGPHVVMDMSFTPHLASKHPKVFSKTIEECLRISKSYRQNFHIHFCGVHEDRKDKDINVMGIDWTPVTVSFDSYLNHYPREKLVYLTSDADQPLDRYSFEDVYIIGGLEKFVIHRLTLDKAKNEGIRVARLPMEMVNMKPHTDLSVPDVLQVLLKLVQTNNNWQEAFSHITSAEKQ